MAKEKKIFDDDTNGVVHKPVEAKGIDWKTSRGRPTKEMDYFDCPFSTDVQYEDFSKEFLIKLLRIWIKWFTEMPLLWREKVTAKFGEEIANDMMIECWEELAQRGMEWYVPLFGPNYKTMDDIKTLNDCAKLALLTPDGGMERKYFTPKVEWENENHAVATVNHCVLLEYFESIGAVDAIEALCQRAEVRGTEAYFGNPCVRVTGIKIPPRKNPRPGDPCCIWDYRMRDKPQPRGKGRKEVGKYPGEEWSKGL